MIVKRDIKLISIKEMFNLDNEVEMILNKEDIFNGTITANMKELEEKGMIKGDYIVVPKGAVVTSKRKSGDYFEYNFNDGEIITDLKFGENEEYYYFE